jgi:hypothetical protein
MSMPIRTIAARHLTTARAALLPTTEVVRAWVAEHAPIVGLAAARRRRRVVLAPYKRAHSLGRTLAVLAALPALGIACLLYGFFFGLTAPFLLVPFVVPIALVAALIIWALPDQRSAPTLPIEFLLPAYFVTLILWPRYLAITLPGLPWINIQRVVGFVMAGFFLISLSVSKTFRSRIYRSASSIKLLWYLFLGYIFVQIFTTIVSGSPIASAQIVIDQQIYWTCTFFLSCLLFRKIDMVERYWTLLCLMSLFIVFVTAAESREQHILWVNHIPPILRVPDPSVQLTLTPTFRPGTNVYRAKATFSTPLALAEYLSLLTPFFLHFAVSRISPVIRAACWLMIPAIFVAVRMTDARLGLVGILASLLLYGLLWTIVRWRSHPRDLLAAATVYAYPVIFFAGIGVVFASHRLKLMVFGDGAQVSSTEARQTQLSMAMSKVWIHPWGYGTGQSGKAMGFAKDAFITIDNYFIALVLDYGLLGVLVWYGMFVTGIVVAVRYCVSAEYGQRREARLLAPLAVSLTAFLIVKWVHGQSDNHAIFFMMLGMISALVYRLRNLPAPLAAATPVLQNESLAVVARR